MASKSPRFDECIPHQETLSGPLVVRCFAQGDRTGHSLWWVDQTPHLIATSLEGTSDQSWPISPPFQELVCENVAAGGRPVLLGVGMAGKSHWSATIEGDALQDAIAFDIACRTAMAPERLSSDYRIDANWQLGSLTPKTMRLDHQAGFRLMVEAIGDCQLHFADHILSLRPLWDMAQHQRGKTYRWRYVMRSEN